MDTLIVCGGCCLLMTPDRHAGPGLQTRPASIMQADTPTMCRMQMLQVLLERGSSAGRLAI